MATKFDPIEGVVFPNDPLRCYFWGGEVRIFAYISLILIRSSTVQLEDRTIVSYGTLYSVH